MTHRILTGTNLPTPDDYVPPSRSHADAHRSRMERWVGLRPNRAVPPAVWLALGALPAAKHGLVIAVVASVLTYAPGPDELGESDVDAFAAVGAGIYARYSLDGASGFALAMASVGALFAVAVLVERLAEFCRQLTGTTVAPGANRRKRDRSGGDAPSNKAPIKEVIVFDVAENGHKRASSTFFGTPAQSSAASAAGQQGGGGGATASRAAASGAARTSKKRTSSSAKNRGVGDVGDVDDTPPPLPRRAIEASVVARQERVARFTEDESSATTPFVPFDPRCTYSNPKKGGRCKGPKVHESEFCARHTCERFGCFELKSSTETSCASHKRLLRQMSKRRSARGKITGNGSASNTTQKSGGSKAAIYSTGFNALKPGSKAAIPKASNSIALPANAYVDDGDGDTEEFGFGAAFDAENDGAAAAQEVYNWLGSDVNRAADAVQGGSGGPGGGGGGTRGGSNAPRPTASMYEDDESEGDGHYQVADPYPKE